LNIVIVDDQTSARTMLRHVIEDIAPELSVYDFGDPLTALAWCEAHGRPAAARLPHAGDGRAGVRPPFPPPAQAPRHSRDPDHRGRRRADPAGGAGSGVIDFLVKPIRPRELRARCYNLLQRRQQPRT
jgi:two-component system response regulator RpfG